MLGFILVIQNSIYEINGYCCCNENSFNIIHYGNIVGFIELL